MAWHVFGIVLFLFSAVVQYNDPDPLPWILIYAAAAACCGFAWARRLSPVLPLIVSTIAMTWGVLVVLRFQRPPAWSHLFDELHMVNPEVEEPREALGLFLVAIWMGVLAFTLLRQRKARSGINSL